MKPTVKSHLVFTLLLFFSTFMLLEMGLFIAHQLLNVQLKWNLFQYCLSGLNEQTVGHDITKIMFNVLIMYTLARIFFRIAKQIYMSCKWNRIFHAKENTKLTKILNSKYRNWNTRFLVVQDDSFIALTIGMLRPKIIVSSGLLGMFSEQETKSILLHEWHHYRNYDPLKIFITTVISDGMGYIPIIRASVRYYKTWSELLADRFVIKKMDSVYDLANVLLRLSNLNKVRNYATGVYFANSTINYRIQQVLEPEKSIHVPFLQTKPVLLSLFVIFVLSSIVMGGCA
ncbi:M56 family metallopeptidase [Paenibacillus sp. GYB004]|uniref:M56 family metallopeptidase n=1 Tax=Paenibacillus sp. GYB004 TaxID=2994393 RepID=UPI002F969DCB